MKKDRADIMIEKPRRLGEEAEFFLQTNAGRSVTCAAHIHNAVELLYVRSGSYKVILDGAEYRIGVGDLILFCSNSIHNVVSEDSPENEYYVIKIPPSFFFEFSRRERGAEYIMRFAIPRKENKCLWRREELESSELLPILELLIKEYNEERYAAEIAIRIKIMELLLAILREDSHSQSRTNDKTVETIYGVMLYVRSNFAEDIDERELARSVGMSYSYFSRSFKRVSGMTFRRYLNITRVNKAEQMLLTGDLSITEIASMCGYSSTSYFINVYRAVTGKTPYRAFRENGE